MAQVILEQGATSMKKIGVLFLFVSLSWFVVGCGGTPAEPTAEEDKKAQADMQAETEKMQSQLPPPDEPAP